jgi:superfamily II DNA or RNA helicase
LARRFIPTIDLLIVDEAHKLKNPWSMRSRAMRYAFDRRFLKTVFLTATPFQLDVGELREIFKLFARAKNAPQNLLDQVEGLLDSVRNYQRQYDEFEETWSSLDPLIAGRFAELYERDVSSVANLNDPSVLVIKKQIAKLRH